MEQVGVDLGRDCSDSADDAPGLDCGVLLGGSSGVVSSELLGSAKAMTVLIVFKSSGKSIHSRLQKKWLSLFRTTLNIVVNTG